jgi:DNA invertase Pin-like site-specific DNA recombinase
MGRSQIFPGPSMVEPSVAKPAAQYVRASTDHQSYSTENQKHAIQCYAVLHGMEIVRSYSDEGKSGLNIAGRSGLQELLSDIQSGRADFETLLVYDVSRWGRFQDTDESAHYEYLCRYSNIRVVYCAESFKNDGSPTSTIIKGLKRAMAAEYSRELSEKVFIGQSRLVEKGFRLGGRAGFGFRRLLVDHYGQHKGILPQGSLKSIQSDRVVLVRGPDEEVSTVRKMFDLFVFHKIREEAIARILNNDGILTDTGRRWGRCTVHCILTNEKYIGNSVFGRSAAKLKGTRVRVAATKNADLVVPFRKIISAGTSARLQELESELRNLQARLEDIQNWHGINSIRLVVVQAHLRWLLSNRAIEKWLTTYRPIPFESILAFAETTRGQLGLARR